MQKVDIELILLAKPNIMMLDEQDSSAREGPVDTRCHLDEYQRANGQISSVKWWTVLFLKYNVSNQSGKILIYYNPR